VIAVITFYLLMERKNLNYYLIILFGENTLQAKKILKKIEKRLGDWVRGQTLLCGIVGLMVYLGLLFLDIEYALPLALLAGILEVVPNIGPTLSAVPAVFLGFVRSPVLGFAVVALYFLVQQIENSLIVPAVMKKTVGLNPLITILSLMIGLKIAGILGAILAVPIVLTLEVLASEILKQKSQEARKPDSVSPA
jgi:predicted PurR-regulated permease PerM